MKKILLPHTTNMPQHAQILLPHATNILRTLRNSPHNYFLKYARSTKSYLRIFQTSSNYGWKWKNKPNHDWQSYYASYIKLNNYDIRLLPFYYLYSGYIRTGSLTLLLRTLLTIINESFLLKNRAFWVKNKLKSFEVGHFSMRKGSSVSLSC